MVSYLFLKTSNSRINKKKPPNSRINEKKPPNSRINEKKPTNSRLYYSELRGKSRILNSRISNSRKIPGPKKHELGGNTVFETHMCKTKHAFVMHSKCYDSIYTVED